MSLKNNNSFSRLKISCNRQSNVVLCCFLDQPSIDVPEEIVSDENLELTCYVPDNCPDMTPEIQWMYTDYLPDPEFSSDYVEEGNTAVMSSTLAFVPRPMHNGQLLGCRVYYPNTTLVYERLISLDIKCTYRNTNQATDFRIFRDLEN